MSKAPRKNTLDEMTIRRTEVPAGDKSRPHKPSLDEMHGIEEVPRSDGERPRPRSIGGRPGSEAGRRGRKR
jgi:excinuclease ABC subunit B